ncbi:MAG: hypothetical protein K2W85_16705 [Phycisphaerales bacterium]|nr:hypothetical protein [Phycisphaerales bacterium]
MPTHARHSTRPLLFSVLVVAIASTSHADIVNPSFEQVYPNPLVEGWSLPVGWEVGSDDWVWADSGYLPILPTHGQWLAGTAFGYSLSQQVALNAGDQVLVDVAMTCDAWYAEGWAEIRLGDWQSPAALARSYVVMSRYNTSLIGWHTLSLTVPASGTYELALQGVSGGTGDGTINFYFDNVRVVPTQGAGTLLGLGGVLAARRRR